MFKFGMILNYKSQILSKLKMLILLILKFEFEGRMKFTIQVRALQKEDFHHGYCDLLSKLTKVGDVSEEMFSNQFDLVRFKKSIERYFVRSTILVTGRRDSSLFWGFLEYISIFQVTLYFRWWLASPTTSWLSSTLRVG